MIDIDRLLRLGYNASTLPLALPEIMLGINQTLMMGLSIDSRISSEPDRHSDWYCFCPQ